MVGSLLIVSPSSLQDPGTKHVHKNMQSLGKSLASFFFFDLNVFTTLLNDSQKNTKIKHTKEALDALDDFSGKR